MQNKNTYKVLKLIIFTYFLCSLNGFHYRPIMKIVIGVMYLRELDSD